VPLVLFPQTPEQDAVAKRVEELGAGVRLKSISEEDVLQALRQIIYEPGYKDNAVKVSESFRSCGGAAEARAFLEEIADVDLSGRACHHGSRRNCGSSRHADPQPRT
jgi:UDP:flavonoid glycosyltransferase YjiC (YdhE family)